MRGKWGANLVGDGADAAERHALAGTALFAQDAAPRFRSGVNLVAVTATRTVLPWSAPTSVYELAVAPATFTQLAPAASQFCH